MNYESRVAITILIALFLTFVGCQCSFSWKSTPAKAQMPPLYVELWLPYISNYTPLTFPPCHCDPDKPVCVCAR